MKKAKLPSSEDLIESIKYVRKELMGNYEEALQDAEKYSYSKVEYQAKASAYRLSVLTIEAVFKDVLDDTNVLDEAMARKAQREREKNN